MKKKYVLFIIFCFLTLILFSCSKTPETYDAYDNIHIESWDEVESVITEGLFLVYYYSPHCPDCKSIEIEFSKIIYDRGEDYHIYLMKSMSVDEQGTSPIELRGVPALFVYKDKVFEEMILGPGNVIEYMRNL
jgi:hypothetical protein